MKQPRRRDFYYVFKGCRHRKTQRNTTPKGNCVMCERRRLDGLAKRRDAARKKARAERAKQEGERIAQIVELHHQGLPQREIAQRVGCSQTKVWRTISGPAVLAPINLRDFAPVPLPVVDLSGRAYSLFPLKQQRSA